MNHDVPRRSREFTEQVINALDHGVNVFARAHAGAGKTGGADSGMVRIAAHLAETGRRAALLFSQNEQVVDFLDRMAAIYPDVPVTFVPASASWGTMPDRIRLMRQRPAGLHVARSGGQRDRQARLRLQTGAPGVYVMTADKLTYLSPEAIRPDQKLTEAAPFEVVGLDEGWMRPASAADDLRCKTDQVFTIGDPAQIPSFTTTGRWPSGMVGSPVEPLPDRLLRDFGGAAQPHNQTLSLNVSRRLPSHTTDLVGRLPQYALDGGTLPLFNHDEVPLEFAAAGIGVGAVDDTLARLSQDGVVLHRLPETRTVPSSDADMARACADLAVRVVDRGAVARSPVNEDRRLTNGDVVILVAHHDQRVAVEQALEGRPIHVTTFNAFQGRTTTVAVVWHPLSGLTDLDTFHLETGRLVVGLTRATHGLILVSRDGIARRLTRAPASAELLPGGPDSRFEALQAHRIVLDHVGVAV